jgi:transposase
MGAPGVRLPSAGVWLALEPVDMRCGMERLSRLVQHALGRTPCDGAAYVFRSARGHRLKLLVWDATGVWLATRRLHKGRFVWPTAAGGEFAITPEQWSWRVTGIDWQRLCAAQPTLWEV